MRNINDDILYDIDNSINNEKAKHRIKQEREKLDYEKQYYIKEIEKLKEKIENMKMSYETDAEAKYYDFVNRHESKLQQRIDKAIEYIKDYEKTIEEGIKKGAEYTYLGSPLNKINKLLDILKGEDKE